MKQIRKLLFVLLATPFIFSCGEAGIGFDVTADFPVTAPIDIPIPANPLHPTIENVDPDATVLDYNLGDVGAFDDALNELGNIGIAEDAIQLNGLSFEITGIDSDEELPLDALNVIVLLGTTNITIPLADGTLQNKSKTQIELRDENGNDVSGNLLDVLRNSGGINTEIVVDIGNIQTSSSDRIIDFDFKLYFDVLLKVRDIN